MNSYHCEIVKEIAKGKTAKEMAVSFGRSYTTMQNRVSELLMRFDAPNRTVLVLKALAHGHISNPYTPFDDCYLKILNELAKGKTASEMATTLYISQNTIERRIAELLIEYEVPSRQALVLKALAKGIIKNPFALHERPVF